MRTGSVLLCVAAATLMAVGQSVISTHAGVVYYFDGAVYLGDQPLQPHLGTFPAVPRGAELRTEQGHAEVLLTPGVFLRIGEHSSMRMISNDLANAQVEFESGSAMLDSGQPATGTSVTLIFKGWQVRSGEAGSYRLDSDPPRLTVVKGEAEVAAASGQPVKVEQGMDLPLAKVLVPEQSGPEPIDGLSAWDQGRSDSIVADNAVTQQLDADPGAQTADADGFSYFPMLGVPPLGVYSSPYSSIYPAQPGFYSMYLPGYTYQPLLFGLMGGGGLGRIPALPLHLGTMTGFGGVRPGVGRIGGVGGVPRPMMPRPAAVPVRPMVRPAIHR